MTDLCAGCELTGLAPQDCRTTASPFQCHICVAGRSCGSAPSESCLSHPKQDPLRSAVTQEIVCVQAGPDTMSILEHVAVIPGADGVALHLLRQGQTADQRAPQKTVLTP